MFFPLQSFFFFLFSSLLPWLETAIKGKITCSKYQTGFVLSEKEPGEGANGAKIAKEHLREAIGILLTPLCGMVFLTLHLACFH